MRPLSKRDRFILRAVEAGFKTFEAEAFIHVLARFEHSIRVEEKEACAKVAEEYAGCEITRAKIAEAIRERETK